MVHHQGLRPRQRHRLLEAGAAHLLRLHMLDMAYLAIWQLDWQGCHSRLSISYTPPLASLAFIGCQPRQLWLVFSARGLLYLLLLLQWPA